MAERERLKSGPDLILVDPTGVALDTDNSMSNNSNEKNKEEHAADTVSNVRSIFKPPKQSKKNGQHGDGGGRQIHHFHIDTPLEVHVSNNGAGNVQTRRDCISGGGSTGTKTSPSSAENGSGHGSRAPTALAGWSPTSMTTTASMSVNHSPALLDTSQGSVSKIAFDDTPSPQYPADITLSSETPSPPRRQHKPTGSKNLQHMNGVSFQPRASLYNNVNAKEESENVDSTVVMRKKQSTRGRGRVGRDGNNILRAALEKHFEDPSNKDLDDYVRYTTIP